jgi:PPOX class probable F420-dependent enzyme
MSNDERVAFLADVHIGVLAVARPDGPPEVVPVWYRYQPGGVVELTTEQASAKVALLREAGRASLCVQREDYPYAYVTVEGPVSIGLVTRELRVEIAARYLGAEQGAAYVDENPDGDDIMIRLEPRRWRTADFAKLG